MRKQAARKLGILITHPAMGTPWVVSSNYYLNMIANTYKMHKQDKCHFLIFIKQHDLWHSYSGIHKFKTYNNFEAITLVTTTIKSELEKTK